jgi:hypothetical protein
MSRVANEQSYFQSSRGAFDKLEKSCARQIDGSATYLHTMPSAQALSSLLERPRPSSDKEEIQSPSGEAICKRSAQSLGTTGKEGPWTIAVHECIIS